ncbi:MAG: ADP-ribosylglycohydrolase family protein [Chloroflexi bacterium]|nr:ADP-ribosylglycohydrolase family protein [Chloroflexota bacterium]
MVSSNSKAHGCLAGVALGDALGRATEFMTRDHIREKFGWLDHFAAPFDAHPGFADPLGVVTDDTEQTLMIARLLATGEPLTPERVAHALVESARDHPSPYIGPSTRRALARLIEGASPYETGTQGTTNGAAMRVAPIGIVHAGDSSTLLKVNFENVLRDAVAASIPTHNTHNAMASAGAVACAIANAMTRDATIETIIASAQEGAQRGRAFGAWSWATQLEKRIELAVRLARESKNLDDALKSLYDYVGVGLDPAESVASAFGVIVAARGDPMTAIFAGVNLGGDTDTIAGIAGGICGALRGIEALDQKLLREVERVNGLDFASIAAKLVMRDPISNIQHPTSNFQND